ncbi:MAG: hypothetical protein AAF355_00360 [Myxococcota bacterium]
MSHRFPSEGWTAAFKDAVNQNEAYRTHGKPWTFGAVAMVVEADAALGIEQPMAMVLDVHEGVCRNATLIKGEQAIDESPTSFVIKASYHRWKEVIEGSLDPIKGMMEGKLRLTKGHLPTMIRFVESSRALVASAKKVDTEYL